MPYFARVLLVLFVLLMPIQVASAQTQNEVLAADITCLDLDGAYVFSQESSPIYLGFFGSQFASDSIMNEFGTYGSRFNNRSVRNELGLYGSPYGTYSANNRLTSTPPVILKQGSLIAYLTANPLIVGGVSLATIDASCTFFASSPAIDDLPPAVPTSVSASDGLYIDAIEVTWSPASGAAIYTIFRAESKESTPEPIGTTSETVFPVFDAIPGKIYWFWVAASNNAGESGLSEPDSGYIAVASTSFSLTVQKTGDGSGSISSSPSGIDCGSTCTAEYSEGSQVTLMATSDTGSTFIGWSGACTGTGACTITMDGDKTVSAEYRKDKLPVVEERASIYLPVVIK